MDIAFLGESVKSVLDELKLMRQLESLHAANYELAILLIELRVLFSQKTKCREIPCYYVGPFFSFEKNTEDDLSRSLSNASFEKKNFNFKEFSYTHSDKLIRFERSPSFIDDAPIDDGTSSHKFDSSSFFDDSELKRKELIKKIQVLCENNNEHYGTWFVLGCLYEVIGNIDLAIKSWRKAFQLNKNSIFVLAALSELQFAGFIKKQDIDYSELFRTMNKFFVHGDLALHKKIYYKFYKKGYYKDALNSLKILSYHYQNTDGFVPESIEIMRLLGSYVISEKHGDLQSQDVFKQQIEALVEDAMSSLVKSNTKGLFDIAELCHEFHFTSPARNIYFSLLGSKSISRKSLVQAARMCLNYGASSSLRDVLNKAYVNSRGDFEVRELITQCNVALMHGSYDDYTLKKRHASLLFEEKKYDKARGILEELCSFYNEDSSIHFLLSEIFFKQKMREEAYKHSKAMYSFDSLNILTLLKHFSMLLKIDKFYEASHFHKILSSREKDMSKDVNSEFYSCSAAFYHHSKDYPKAFENIEKSLKLDPWNTDSILLSLKISFYYFESLESQYLPSILDIEKVNSELFKSTKLSRSNYYHFLKIGENLIENGVYFVSWQWAKLLLITFGNSFEVRNFLIKAGASFHQRLATKECLLLMSKYPGVLSFAELALIIAHILIHSNELDYMHEWLEMAEQSQEHLKEINYIKALELCLKNENLSKAQTLLESDMNSEFYSSQENLERSFLLGYIYTARGEFKKGFSKMEAYLKTTQTIFHSFFYLKALMSLYSEEQQKKKVLSDIYKYTPATLLDKKMLEEIYLLFGSYLKGFEVKHVF